MVKYYNSKGLSNNLGTPSTLKITRKSKKFVAVSMVLSSLLLGSLTPYATTEIFGVYTPSIVYAETLSELQAKYSELNEQYNSKLAEVQKYDKEMESHSGDLWKGWFSAWGTAKVNKEKAEGELAKILEQKNEVSSKIVKDPTQKKINDIDRGVSAAYSYAGKDAGDKEKAKAEQQKALVQTEQELKEGSAKSQADENSKKSNKGKTESNYKGGTDQNINTKDNDRQYVKDPRRSSTDAIKFISDDEATKSLMESSTKTINSAIGNKNLLVYSKDGMLSFSSSIYRSLSKDDQRKTMSFALKTIKESQLPSKVKTKVTNFIADQDRTVADSIQALNSDTSSELSAGYSWFIPFASPFSTMLGVFAIIIFVFLTVSIVVDVAYLTVGVFRQFLENGEGRPKFVSGEAWETAREVDMSLQSGTYKDYLVVYFRKRMSILIITSFVLAYLISGQIYSVFTALLDVFRELFNIRG
jgi:hypothetical protein